MYDQYNLYILTPEQLNYNIDKYENKTTANTVIFQTWNALAAAVKTMTIHPLPHQNSYDLWPTYKATIY